MPSLHRRAALGFVALLAASAPAVAQESVVLAEEIKSGDCFRVDIGLTVEGKMKVERDGKLEPIGLKSKAAHAYVERVESPDSRGGIGNVLRHYSAAASDSDVGTDRSRRELPADRRLVVAKRTADGSLHYSPNGQLAREELELVAEHFDTMILPALLSGKETKVGDTWTVAPDAAQHACLFDGLIKSDLVGKLSWVKDGVAEFEINGKAEGTEHGAHARVVVAARGRFDVVGKRVTDLAWDQYDDRATGPASPATEVKANVVLKRAFLADEPKEVGADVRAKLPTEEKVTAALSRLRYTDSEGRYRFAYSRDWHVVGRTKDHLVLRLLDGGEFAAQATVTNWKKADPGKHATPEEFKGVIAKLNGWAPEQTLADGEMPAAGGKWVYRVVATGKQDGLAVVQSFFLTAGPNGEQVAVTVVTRKEKAEKVAGKDLGLVQAIELGAEK